MANWKTDRATIFLGLLFVLFLWDLAYFLGLTDPARLPHPFVVFRALGDVELLHGLPTLLRYFIFTFVFGGTLGIGAGCLFRRNDWVAEISIQILRLGQWLPFILVFAIPDPWSLGIAAATFGSCYYYLVTKTVLKLEWSEGRSFVARETALQTLLFSLIAQIWLQYWKWFLFAQSYQVHLGWNVFLTVVILLFVIGWFFCSDFEPVANMRGHVLYDALKDTNWKSFSLFLLGTFAFTMMGERIGYLRFPRWSGSSLGAILSGYELLADGELFIDIQVSLLELLGGIFLGGSMALLVVALISANNAMRRTVAVLLPLSNISLMVLWLISFLTLGRLVPNLLFWHKVIAVGCLVFFPFSQALWGLRDKGTTVRILLATDHALPFGFVGFLFGELWAATAGLGFMMTIASATDQVDKGIAGFVITAVLLAGFSAMLRSTARMLGPKKEEMLAQIVGAT